MSDLLTTLPSFPTVSYTHLLPSLEKSLISTSDLLTLDALEIAKRAQLPIQEVKKLAGHILKALHNDLGFNEGEPGEDQGDHEGSRNTLNKTGHQMVGEWHTISLLDDTLDVTLGGGIPTGCITEITGESAAGKTQFLLTLLLSVQLRSPHGLSRSSIYISTESGLPTSRLTQLLTAHPVLSTIPSRQRPSLSRILAIRVQDLEEQDHILAYQLPVAIKRHNVGLVVMDSVAANFRAEHATHHAKAMASRSTALVKLGHLLRKIAREENVAVVVANQVSDRFEGAIPGRTPQDNGPARTGSPLTTSFSEVASPTPLRLQTSLNTGEEVLSLDHQQRFFTGWGDDTDGLVQSANLKTPALGLIWTNQVACRIALKMSTAASRSHALQPAQTSYNVDTPAGRASQTDTEGGSTGQETYIWNERRKKRIMRVVFASWVAGSKERDPHGEGPEFEILKEGIRAVLRE